MGSVAFWLAVIKALIAVLPLIIQIVRENKVRALSQQELVDAILFTHHARVEAARRARDAVDLDGSDLSDDPYNRDNSGPDGRTNG